jgi:hypothetical protein
MELSLSYWIKHLLRYLTWLSYKLELSVFNLRIEQMHYFVKELSNELRNLESFVEILSWNWQFVQYRNVPSIVIVSTCLLLVASILIPNSDLKSRINAIFIQDTLLLTVHSLWFWRHSASVAGRQEYPKQINSLWG